MFQDRASLLRIDGIAAGENVYGRVVELRPGMYGNVGFCDYNDAADPVGIELMEYTIHDCCADLFSCANHDVFDESNVFDLFPVAFVIFGQKVSSEKLRCLVLIAHGLILLLQVSILGFLRTSNLYVLLLHLPCRTKIRFKKTDTTQNVLES